MLSYNTTVSTVLTSSSLLTANTVLPHATRIEALRVFNNAIQVTYWTVSGRCSTFLSKKAFKQIDTEKSPQVGDVVKIKSDRHGEFFRHLPALVKTDDSSIGVVVEVMGQKRFFYMEELALVRSCREPQALIDPENLRSTTTPSIAKRSHRVANQIGIIPNSVHFCFGKAHFIKNYFIRGLSASKTSI